MKLSLKDRNIPRNKVGDPNFVDGVGERLYDVFSPSEVVELVNRSLYQLEYQAKSHEKRRLERELLERPVKEVFRRLYPKQSYAKATDGELQRCMDELRK
jgi:hypothetical protein